MAGASLGQQLGCTGMYWDGLGCAGMVGLAPERGGTAQLRDDCQWEQQNRALVMGVSTKAEQNFKCETMLSAPAPQALASCCQAQGAFCPLFPKSTLRVPENSLLVVP